MAVTISRNYDSKEDDCLTRTFIFGGTRPAFISLNLVTFSFWDAKTVSLTLLSDELALLFTGSRVPKSFKTTDTETIEEEDSGPQEGDKTYTPSPSVSGAQTPVEAPSIPPPAQKVASAVHPSLVEPSSLPHPLFSIEQLGVDRRLLVNRKRQLKMYRVWMQGKFRKLEHQ